VFPDDSPALAWLWYGAAAALAAYLAPFMLAKRPVSLRMRRLGGSALGVFLLRLLMIPLGVAMEMPVDCGLTAFCLLAGVGLWLAERVWLARVDEGSLREQIEAACRGLFLEYTEPQRGLFLLTARGFTWRLRLVRISRRMQLVVLPQAAELSKAALLLHWLSKQYPGPVPRLHINLKKE
jgi:hypothetical protein